MSWDLIQQWVWQHITKANTDTFTVLSVCQCDAFTSRKDIIIKHHVRFVWVKKLVVGQIIAKLYTYIIGGTIKDV